MWFCRRQKQQPIVPGKRGRPGPAEGASFCHRPTSTLRRWPTQQILKSIQIVCSCCTRVFTSLASLVPHFFSSLIFAYAKTAQACLVISTRTSKIIIIQIVSPLPLKGRRKLSNRETHSRRTTNCNTKQSACENKHRHRPRPQAHQHTGEHYNDAHDPTILKSKAGFRTTL